MNINNILRQVKTNDNIEIILKNLWAVNFDYLSNNWINGITIDILDNDSYLTIVGFAPHSPTIVILNKGHRYYDKILPIIKYVMKLTIHDIRKRTTFYGYFRYYFKKYKNCTNKQVDELLRKEDLSKIKDFFDQVCLLEIQRRKDERLRMKKK